MRVSVIGCSGAGKTTFGRRLADRLGCPFVELDAIVHQPGWTRLPDDEFRARVSRAIAGEAWVCDGDYGAVHPGVVARATDLVWLDPPKAVVMAQVITRSVARAITGRELYNGNRERFSEWGADDHPIRWAWAKFEKVREGNGRRVASAEFGHLRVHRLGGRRAVRGFLEGAGG